MMVGVFPKKEAFFNKTALKSRIAVLLLKRMDGSYTHKTEV
jgi:hypothetical protein